ncbi:NADPH dehydrogenase NamA [Bacillus alkalicellulosilyticus]|uniref:NADPH dehydrogenase NamA n=1 Tax=Alkalihalobacterium alkalicellulosilyticum TaxID=1912214 RepID=UPI000998869F|nr:NADPH dehydrogenase NamA [Bacillus alkalicellulosilyticus]
MNTPALFSSYQIKNVTLPNRIVMSPMCMYSATGLDGKVTDFHFVHYTSRAVGQVGLIMVEATAVLPQGRISDRDLGIWNDEHIEGLRRIVNGVHQYGSKAAIQLAHAGRKAELDGTIYAPSAIPFNEDMKVPTEMSKEDIEETINAFKEGAVRAKAAGFDIIEIHAAHGYLINEFLSPLTNQRTDEYGGNEEKRYQFLKEVIQEVKTVWDGPLFVRISASEYAENGTSIETFITYAKWMKEQGIDLIDCSSGGVVPAPIHTFPGYQVRFAERIKMESEIATGAVGLITSGLQAEEIVQNGRADVIFLGRELLRDPYWPRLAANELGFTLKAPAQYETGW